MRTRRLAAGLLVACALTACGTTVPQTTQLTSGPASGQVSAASGGETTGSTQRTTVTGPTTVSAPGGATEQSSGVAVGGQVGASVATSGPAVTGTAGAGGTHATASPGARVTKTGAGKPTAGTKPTASKTGNAASATTASAGTTAPLTIGLSYTDNSEGSAAVGLTETGVTAKQAAEAIVKGINDAGGMDGRMLVPVEYSFNSDSSNYSTEAAAACAKFTQDSHVPVVLDSAFGEDFGFGPCLAKAGVLLISTYGEPDAATSAALTLHATADVMNVDRNYASVITDLDQSGYLGKRNQLGIIVEDCPEDDAAYQNTLVPLIAKLGLKTPVKTTIDCTNGIGAAANASTAASNAVLTFRQAGVDRMMFISAFEGTGLLLFSEAASSQKYDPGYALSSNAAAAANRASLPSDQWPQLVGAGYTPLGDVDNPPTPLPAEKRCLALAAAAQVTPASTGDMGTIIGECNPELLLEAALKQTGGNSDPHALAAAIDGLGSGFASPGVLGDTTTFGPNRHDGPNEMQLFAYSASCTCIRSSGAPIPAL